MPGLDDIPQHLRDPKMKTEFVRWLAIMPIDPMIKRNLIARWRLTYHVTFDPMDYRIALATPVKKQGT